MDSLVIQGGVKLRGAIAVNGAKNAALPIMAAALLSDEPSLIRGVPDLQDVRSQIALLTGLGAAVLRQKDSALEIRVRDQSQSHAPYDLVRKMRAGICVLGPLLARRGRARVSMPGGCAIGDRPVDLHLRGLAALGARIRLENGDIVATAKRLRGAEIFLGGNFGSTVLGTANVMCAATLARGQTVIEGAACEPETVDLANYLNAMGARITGQGTPRLIIEGVRELHGCDYRVIPDRIEAGTFLVAAAISRGELRLQNVRLDHLVAVIDKLRQIGVRVEKCNGGAHVAAPQRLQPGTITTQPYPGFPTDLQAQFMALLALAHGNSIITEKIFPDRFLHVAELARLGARVHREGATVMVEGQPKLIAAPVMASDLRASAALLIAGLVAKGETRVKRIYHLDRGYAKIDEKLRGLGAKVERVQD